MTEPGKVFFATTCCNVHLKDCCLLGCYFTKTLYFILLRNAALTVCLKVDWPPSKFMSSSKGLAFPFRFRFAAPMESECKAANFGTVGNPYRKGGGVPGTSQLSGNLEGGWFKKSPSDLLSCGIHPKMAALLWSRPRTLSIFSAAGPSPHM